MKRKNRRRFSLGRFLSVFVLSATLLYGVNYLFGGGNLPRSDDLESKVAASATIPSSSEESENKASIPSTETTNELSKLKSEIASRHQKAQEIYQADSGKLFVDESYGGSEVEREDEKPIARLQIPALDFEREVWRGVGASENGSAGFGDDKRLFKAVTWRADQTLGGDNFTVVSHVWNGTGFGDYSKDWFSPLLTSKDGGITTDLSKLKLQKGDEIKVTESETGYIFNFKITEISTALHGNDDGTITDQVKEMLGARIDHPRITLQGCLMGTDQLFFVVGELKSVQRGESVYNLE